VIEILDVAALHQGDDFDIIGGFKSTWRAHAWEGAEICYSFCVHQHYENKR